MAPGRRPVDGDLRERLAALEERVESIAPREWVKDWVSDTIKPLSETVARMEVAFKSVSEQADTLFAAHDTLLKERAQREEHESSAKIKELQALAESRRPMALVKRYLPLLTFVGAILSGALLVVKFADRILTVLFQHYGNTH